jgi:hypothetical protein
MRRKYNLWVVLAIIFVFLAFIATYSGNVLSGNWVRLVCGSLIAYFLSVLFPRAQAG